MSTSTSTPAAGTESAAALNQVKAAHTSAAAYASSLHHSLLGPSLLKAGQEGVDQAKAAEIIYNASKGSKFFKHEEKRDEQLTKRIEAILQRKKELESGNLSNELRRADEKIFELEQQRDLSQYIVHVDCDAFYASVEELDRPELKDVPMAVGGGVLTTCNYKAREYGVRSGMAGHIAKKLCPKLVFLPINFDKYNAKAKEVRAVLVKYDPRFEAASVDEAFLNITAYLKDHEGTTPDEVVEQIRQEVLESTKITVSAGIAPNAKIAKICSNKRKPNNQFRVPNDRQAVMEFMADLPVRAVNGVGRVFERELDAIGIKTCGDIYTQRALLRDLFGGKAFVFLLNCYLGLGRTEIQPIEEYERKSVGTESTFRDLTGSAKLREKLRYTAGELEKDLRSTQFSGRTITLKVKLHNYQVYTRQRALNRAIYKSEDLYQFALPLLQSLEAEFNPLKIRLMGLRLNQLVTMKKVPIDTHKWFFGNVSSSSKKRKIETAEDESEWEIWPEEEFEKAQADEKAEERRLAEEAAHAHEQGLRNNERAGSEHGINTSAEGSPMTWECPICIRLQPADDSLFNQHVDFCLSKQAIRQAVQQSSNAPLAASAAENKKAKSNGDGRRAFLSPIKNAEEPVPNASQELRFNPPSTIDPSGIHILDIISSHSISAKTTRCLSLLYPSNTSAAPAVGLRAKGPVASKATTIAEIVKRRIGDCNERWFQYTKLEKGKEEVLEKEAGNNADSTESEGSEGAADDSIAQENDEDDNPPVPSEENEVGKKRAMPMVTIYLSRARIEGFKELYGEQTGGSAS